MDSLKSLCTIKTVFLTCLELFSDQILVFKQQKIGWRIAISYYKLYFQKFAISAKLRTDVEDDKMIFTHIIVLSFGYRMLNQGHFSLSHFGSSNKLEII